MTRGEVWLVNLDPTLGAEMKKTRPAVIVSDDAIGKLPLKVIVPITDWKENYTNVSWMVRLEPSKENGLSKVSSADVFQIRSVSQKRFVQQIGKLSDAIMQKIGEALLDVLALEPEVP